MAQERFDNRFATAKFDEQFHGIARSARLEDSAAEIQAGIVVENALVFKS